MDWQSFFRKNLEQVDTYQPGLREDQVWEFVEADKIYKLSSNESPSSTTISFGFRSYTRKTCFTK